MKTLSIDASTKSTGVAIYDNKELKYYNAITSSSTNLFKRIKIMVDGIDNLIKEWNVTKIIVEEVIPSAEVNGPKTMQTYKALMYLQGAICMMLNEKHPNVEIEFTYPSSWRSSCGISTGRGIKREELKLKDIQFVNKQFNLELTNDDIADAIGIGWGYLNPKNSNPTGSINWK